MRHNREYQMQNGRDVHHAYSTDGEESHQTISVRTSSEYGTAHKPNAMTGRTDKRGSERDLRDSPPAIRNHAQSSEIYITSGDYRSTPDFSNTLPHHSPLANSKYGHGALSNYSYGSARSGLSNGSTVKTKIARHGGLVVETMSTPNPFCPNTKGMCCLLLLINLGIILITLGFVIVIQIFHPLIVWILGIIFLIFGFATLIGSLIYCVHVFRNAKHPHEVNPEDFYWTRYWQGQVASIPEFHYKAEEKYPDDTGSDRGSKYSSNYYDRRNQHY
ncbi:uncharacterized protein [Fopius arisanus]|nr:PREDICTED: uncharacterized protein LOC105272335 isoform X2 [Fopius arisanus]XP_011312737.1 PREDICTED: uncharacterized protein LOC105272335 isoform X2 [Fopius arisanus]